MRLLGEELRAAKNDLGRLVTPDRDTIVEGHAGVCARYTDTAHSQWEGRSHHVSAGPEAILVDGDEARALTYAFPPTSGGNESAARRREYDVSQRQRDGARMRLIVS